MVINRYVLKAVSLTCLFSIYIEISYILKNICVYDRGGSYYEKIGNVGFYGDLV